MITSETINNLIMSGLIELKSVGSYLDTDIGVVYPMEEDGSPDYDCAISLVDDEVASDWYDGLSKEDYQIVKPFI